MYTMYNHRIFHSTRKSEVTKVSEPNLSAMMFETSPLTRDTRTCCRALGSGAVTTFFNDLGLSQPGIEPQCPACEPNARPLSHLLLYIHVVKSFTVKNQFYK